MPVIIHYYLHHWQQHAGLQKTVNTTVYNIQHPNT